MDDKVYIPYVRCKRQACKRFLARVVRTVSSDATSRAATVQNKRDTKMPRFVSLVPCIVLIGVLLIGVGSGCQTRSPDPEAARTAIRGVLDAQVAAWNRGDIEAFMDGYAQTDSLRFASGGSVYRGWEAALERYQTSYPDRAAMGMLAFRHLDIRLLGPASALVFGRWQLTREADAPSGLFTLLFVRRANGWRIVHDHTSTASP